MTGWRRKGRKETAFELFVSPRCSVEITSTIRATILKLRQSGFYEVFKHHLDTRGLSSFVMR